MNVVPKPPVFATLGCRLNAYETEAMRELAAAAGVEGAVVVNTCAVTAEAVRKAKQEIRRLARENPGAAVIVTGCAAQTEPETFAAMPEVTRVIGNTEKMQASTWAAMVPDLIGKTERVQVDDIMSVVETAGHLIDGFGRYRAYVQVQNGCDHRCTFCIIPFGRGPNRSVPIGAIADQVRTLVATGFQEIVLTGVDIASYGPDLPGRPTLGQMARRLLAAVPELPRLRLSSIDPAAIDDDLWRLIETEPRLMPHLHFSLQAGSDLILKRMKRRHLRQQALDVIARARTLRPGIGIGADLIAGFPTETDFLFNETLQFVEEAKIPFVHVFPYSERPGTPAARMPAVPVPVRRERAARLRAAGAIAARNFYAAQIGTTVTVLAETATSGHTEHFAPVQITATPGQLLRARVTAATDHHLLAEPA